MDLGVAAWTTGPAGTPPVGAVGTVEPRDPEAPDWWTGENTNEFLAEQGVILG